MEINFNGDTVEIVEFEWRLGNNFKANHGSRIKTRNRVVVNRGVINVC